MATATAFSLLTSLRPSRRRVLKSKLLPQVDGLLRTVYALQLQPIMASLSVQMETEKSSATAQFLAR